MTHKRQWLFSQLLRCGFLTVYYSTCRRLCTWWWRTVGELSNIDGSCRQAILPKADRRWCHISQVVNKWLSQWLSLALSGYECYSQDALYASHATPHCPVSSLFEFVYVFYVNFVSCPESMNCVWVVVDYSMWQTSQVWFPRTPLDNEVWG